MTQEPRVVRDRASLPLVESEQIDCACMGVVHGEDFFEQAESVGLFAEPESRLRFKEASRNGLAPGKVFIEEQHGGQGSSEVVDLRLLVLKMGGVVEDCPEGVEGILLAAETAQGQGAPIGVLGDGLYLHLLKVTLLVSGTGPVTFGFAAIAGIVVRHAKPVVNHAEVHQQVFGFAEILGRAGCGKQAGDGRCGLSTLQRTMGQQYIATNILRQHKALAALPRLEFVAEELVESTPGLIEIIAEGGEFDREVVPLFNERCVVFEVGQSLGEGMAGALQELVIFVQNASVGWRGGAGFGEGFEGADWIVERIEVPDAEITPGSGEGLGKCSGALPHHDGFGVAAAVIQQVAEIVGCMRIAWIFLDRLAEQDEFFEAAGKDAGRISVASALADRSTFVRTSKAMENVGLQIE